MKKTLLMMTAAIAAVSACKKAEAPAAPANDVAATSAANSAAADPRPATTAVELAAKPLSGADAVAAQKARHDNFEKIGKSMKTLSEQSKRDTPNIQAVTAAANELASLSAALPGWFNPGTGPEAGKTEAKADIWQNGMDFRAKAVDMNRNALALKAAVDAGDPAAFKAAVAPLGASCKACHDSYKVKDKA